MNKRNYIKILICTLFSIVFCFNAFATGFQFPYISSDSEYIYFGKYEQDNNRADGKEDVEWYVLYRDEENKKALLLSTHVLDVARFDEKLRDTSWEECTLRSYLNNEFKEECFNEAERSAIAPSVVRCAPTDRYNASGIKEYSTLESNSTVDYIFIPSITEIEVWFDHDKMTKDEFKTGHSSAREAKATKYTEKKGLVNNNTSCIGVQYWLRSLANDKKHACFVNYDKGTETKTGQLVNNISGIRPAMWVCYQ